MVERRAMSLMDVVSEYSRSSLSEHLLFHFDFQRSSQACDEPILDICVEGPRQSGDIQDGVVVRIE